MKQSRKKAEAASTVTGNETSSKGQETTNTPQGTEPSQPRPTGPSYPTSSRNGPVNWDKVTADEPETEENDVNGFFKHLFQKGTPEQQRAMVKSFTESGGTSLSTDWDDVGNRKVDIVPPQGMEAKRWES